MLPGRHGRDVGCGSRRGLSPPGGCGVRSAAGRRVRHLSGGRGRRRAPDTGRKRGRRPAPERGRPVEGAGVGAVPEAPPGRGGAGGIAPSGGCGRARGRGEGVDGAGGAAPAGTVTGVRPRRAGVRAARPPDPARAGRGSAVPELGSDGSRRTGVPGCGRSGRNSGFPYRHRPTPAAAPAVRAGAAAAVSATRDEGRRLGGPSPVRCRVGFICKPPCSRSGRYGWGWRLRVVRRCDGDAAGVALAGGTAGGGGGAGEARWHGGRCAEGRTGAGSGRRSRPPRAVAPGRSPGSDRWSTRWPAGDRLPSASDLGALLE